MADIRMYVGNRNPSVTDTITIDGTPFDLSASTVKLQMRLEGSATLKVDAAAVITNAVGGQVRYDWAAADVNAAGDYVAWWQITTSGKTQDTSEFPVYIVEHTLATGALCTLDDVRQFLQKPATDTAQDTVLEALIVRASRLIMRWTAREFAPPATATRKFLWSGGLMLLVPHDLRSVTTVQIDTDTAAPTTLTANSDYWLRPLPASDGVYRWIAFSSSLSPCSGASGQREVEIAGQWGFATIPEDVRHAAVATVAVWARREIQAFTTTFNIAEDRLERPEALPSAVRAMLSHYRDPVVA